MAPGNGVSKHGDQQQNAGRKKPGRSHGGSTGLVWLALAATAALVAVAVAVAIAVANGASGSEYLTAAAAKSSGLFDQVLRQWGVKSGEVSTGNQPPVDSVTKPAGASSASESPASAHSASVSAVSPPASAASSQDPSCTCQVKRLSGVVDDCCCEYETVDELNTQVLQPLLTQLVNTTFFKYFKARLWCDCPFWPDDGMCHSRDCSVGECRDDEVPAPLRCPSPRPPSLLPADVDEPRDADLDSGADESGSGVAESAKAESAGSVDRTVDRSAFQAWVEADNPWTADDESDTASQVYVNLALNPERYTGYGGDSARRIWQAIYQESCFQDGSKDTCTERRVFYRLISGLHQSISVHVAASQIWDSTAGQVSAVGSETQGEKSHNRASQIWDSTAGQVSAVGSETQGEKSHNRASQIWDSTAGQVSAVGSETQGEKSHNRASQIWDSTAGQVSAVGSETQGEKSHNRASQIWDSTAGQWGPNIAIFHHRVAKFPERLANLYFTFLFVLRAATKAADFLSRASYDTGNPGEDAQTATLVQQVVRSERLRAACPLPFDEARMWRGDEGPQLRQTLQGHFRNISLIMDCVGCERCRLWGKLEILGLATALKILFSVDGTNGNSGNGNGKSNGNGNGGGVEQLCLQRNEVVALFNTLWRFSDALKTTAELVSLLEKNPPLDAPAPGAAPAVSGSPAASPAVAAGGGGSRGNAVGSAGGGDSLGGGLATKLLGGEGQGGSEKHSPGAGDGSAAGNDGGRGGEARGLGSVPLRTAWEKSQESHDYGASATV
ncbi:hypothetical protein CLOP_g4679 [Closterium sp. NIES-67]|nr:hypothetical protein CLOP_g4679 [Closterium sp. NIES-67]